MYPEMELKNLLTKLQLKENAVTKALNEMPDGRLMITTNHGKRTFY